MIDNGAVLFRLVGGKAAEDVSWYIPCRYLRLHLQRFYFNMILSGTVEINVRELSEVIVGDSYEGRRLTISGRSLDVALFRAMHEIEHRVAVG